MELDVALLLSIVFGIALAVFLEQKLLLKQAPSVVEKSSYKRSGDSVRDYMDEHYPD